MENYIQKKNGIYIVDKRINFSICKPIIAYKIVIEDIICVYVLYPASSSFQLQVSKCRADFILIGEDPIIEKIVPISNKSNDYKLTIEEGSNNPIECDKLCDILDKEMNNSLEKTNLISTNWIKAMDQYKY